MFNIPLYHIDVALCLCEKYLITRESLLPACSKSPGSAGCQPAPLLQRSLATVDTIRFSPQQLIFGDPKKIGTVNRCPTKIRAANQRFDIDDLMND
jgi:hypothetical protein